MLRGLIHHLGNLLRGARTAYLRATGLRVGQGTMISLGAKIDVRRGRITIGENCLITSGCKILSHDGASRMLDPSDDGSGQVVIGDNVFIGVNTVVLRNVRIGSNTVIGAGSVVAKDIPDGVLAVGVPAKVVRDLPKPYAKLGEIGNREKRC